MFAEKKALSLHPFLGHKKENMIFNYNLPTFSSGNSSIRAEYGWLFLAYLFGTDPDSCQYRIFDSYFFRSIDD